MSRRNLSAAFRALLATALRVDAAPAFAPATDGPAAWQRRDVQLSLLLLAACVGLVALLGYFWAADRYANPGGNPPEFYQSYFTPALNLACSGRLSHATLPDDAQAFLQRQTPTLTSCRGVASAPTTERWDPFDSQSVYLFYATATIWKLTGVSWANLSILAGMLGALVAVGAFVFARAFSPSTLLAVVGAVTIVGSPLFDEHAPHLRDFSKAPFFLLGLGLLALAATRPFGLRSLVALFGLAGLVTGIGMGFRPDTMLIAVAAPVAAVLVMLRPGSLKSAARDAAAGLAAFALALAVAYAPALQVKHRHPDVGSLTSHFFNLGYAETFFETGLEMESPGYAALRPYDDSVALAQTVSHSAAQVSFGSFNKPEYDEVGWAYFGDIAKTLPHDVFLRPFYAAPMVLEGAEPGFKAAGLVLVLTLMAAVFVLPRVALFYLAVAGMLLVVATMQFTPRHYFHLVAFWPAGVLLLFSVLATGVARLRGGRTLVAERNASRLALGALVLTVLALPVADRVTAEVQRKNLAAIQQRYQQAQWRPVTAFWEGSQLRFRPLPAPSSVVLMKMVIDGSGVPGAAPSCAPDEVTVTPVYQWGAGEPYPEYPEALAGAGKNIYFFPVSVTEVGGLVALEIQGRPHSCVRSLSWTPAPPGTPRIELMLVDDVREPPEGRGRLTTSLRRFLFGP